MRLLVLLVPPPQRRPPPRCSGCFTSRGSSLSTTRASSVQWLSRLLWPRRLGSSSGGRRSTRGERGETAKTFSTRCLLPPRRLCPLHLLRPRAFSLRSPPTSSRRRTPRLRGPRDPGGQRQRRGCWRTWRQGAERVVVVEGKTEAKEMTTTRMLSFLFRTKAACS